MCVCTLDNDIFFKNIFSFSIIKESFFNSRNLKAVIICICFCPCLLVYLLAHLKAYKKEKVIQKIKMLLITIVNNN